MSITLMIVVALVVVILVGGKVYLEQKLEKAEKEINDAATEAAKAAEEPIVTVTIEEPTKVEEVAVAEVVKTEPKKTKSPKKRYYKPGNKKKTNKNK